MSAHSPALLATLTSTENRDPAAYLTESDSYLSREEHGIQLDHLQVKQGTRVSVYRHGTPTHLWLALGQHCFSAATILTATEARQIAEALLKAAEDAEEAARAQRMQEDFEDDRQQTAELEDDRMRDFEARGIEYPGPLAMCGDDLQNLRDMQREGHTLPAWGQKLLDEIDAVNAAKRQGPIYIPESAEQMRAYAVNEKRVADCPFPLCPMKKQAGLEACPASSQPQCTETRPCHCWLAPAGAAQ